MTRRFTRTEFYDLVWSEPLSTLAPRFGMSGVALAKACRAAGIPVPERGHWARTRAGKPVRRRPLPPRSPGAPDSVVLGGGHWAAWSTGDDPSAPLPPPPAFEEDVPALAARVQAMLGKVSVPRTLDRPHRLIAALLAEDEARQEKRARAAYPSILDTPKFDTPLERRRLRILNGLFMALERVGCKPSLNGDGRDVRVQVVGRGPVR